MHLSRAERIRCAATMITVTLFLQQFSSNFVFEFCLSKMRQLLDSGHDLVLVFCLLLFFLFGTESVLIVLFADFYFHDR